MKRTRDKCKLQYRQKALLFPCWNNSDRHLTLEVKFLPLHPRLLRAGWRGLSFQRKCIYIIGLTVYIYMDWDLHTNCLPGLIHCFHPSGWLDELFQAFLNTPKIKIYSLSCLQWATPSLSFSFPHSFDVCTNAVMYIAVFLLRGI